MVNILVECPALIASVRVGVLNSLRTLGDISKAVRFRETLKIKRTDIEWADIVICVRGCEPASRVIMESVKKFGRLLIYFLDDDLLNVPDGLSCSDYFNRESIRGSMLDILKNADILWYVNPLIGESYDQYTTARLVLTKIPAEIKASAPDIHNGDKIRVLYAGSVDHQRLADELIIPAAKLLEQWQPGRFSFCFVGAVPSEKGLPFEECHDFFNNYDEYCDFISNGGFSIGLAPVLTSRFYQCKYINKFIEYTRMGITGIYTDSLPYTMVVADNTTGYLTDNTPESWANAILRAADAPKETQCCWQRAVALLEHDFSAQRLADELREKLPELLTFHAPEIHISPFAMPPLRVAFFAERCSYFWKKDPLTAPFMIAAKLFKAFFREIIKGGKTLAKKVFSRDL